MESTLTCSPPISLAMAARSSVAPTTLILPAAWAGMEAASAARTAIVRFIFMENSLKGMRSVGAHGELELEQKFVGREAVSVAGTPKLAADLTEFARPVGQYQRPPCILDERGFRQVAIRDGHRVGRRRAASGRNGPPGTSGVPVDSRRRHSSRRA